MTITLTREEAQQVLDALECMNEGAFNAEIKLLRTRLAQPEPEPWAGVDFDIKTTPPQREWQGLTDEEIDQILVRELGIGADDDEIAEFARAIEAKLKEKNASHL